MPDKLFPSPRRLGSGRSVILTFLALPGSVCLFICCLQASGCRSLHEAPPPWAAEALAVPGEEALREVPAKIDAFAALASAFPGDGNDDFVLYAFCRYRRTPLDLGGRSFDHRCIISLDDALAWSEPTDRQQEALVGLLDSRAASLRGQELGIFARVVCPRGWREAAAARPESLPGEPAEEVAGRSPRTADCRLGIAGRGPGSPSDAGTATPALPSPAASVEADRILDVQSSTAPTLPVGGDGMQAAKEVGVIDLGHIAVKHGLSEEIAFELPAGSVSALLSFQAAKGAGEKAFYRVARLYGPGGREVVGPERMAGMAGLELQTVTGLESFFGDAEAFLSLNRSVSFFPGAAHMLLPNNPRVLEGDGFLPAGRWRLQVGAVSYGRGGPLAASGTVVAGVVVKRDLPAGEAPALGETRRSDRLLVHLHTMGGAVGERSDGDALDGAATAWSELRSYLTGKFAAAGIDLYFVGHERSSGAAPSRAWIQGRMPFGEPGIHLVERQAIQGAEPGAEATGVPGGYGPIQRRRKAWHSPAVVFFSPSPDIRRTGLNLAHEMGHALGLYHEQESYLPDVHDQLEDTRGQTIMVEDPLDSRAGFSLEQAWVMRRHPLVASAGGGIWRRIAEVGEAAAGPAIENAGFSPTVSPVQDVGH